MNSAEGGNIIYKFLGDTKDLDNAIKSTKTAFGTLGSVAKTLGLVVGGITATTTTALVTIMKKSVDAYGELEQLQGGAQKIFDEMDYSKIEQDSKQAFKTMNLSASQYLALINDVGATFSATMGDEKGYETAKTGLQAISDYATGTGKSVDLLGQKFTMITRATSSYQSIADQFSGILPATSKDFLEQAQACGYLSQEYKKLTDVPVAEYQEAVSKMLERGVNNLGLANNTYKESTETLTGSIASAKTALQNFFSGAGGFEEVVETLIVAGKQISQTIIKMLPQIVEGLVGIINGLIPEIPKLVNMLIPAFLKGTVELLRGILKAIPELLTTLATMLPDIVQSLVDVFVEVCEMVGEQAPVIMPIIVDALMEALLVLIENLDVLIEASMKLIQGLTEGLIECLPILTEKAPDIIEALVVALIDSLPILIECSSDIIDGLKEGLIKALPKMWEAGIKVTQKFLDALKESIPNLVNTGLDMIKGIWEGIKKFDIIGKMKNLAGDMINGVKKKLGIASPSKEFAYLGKMSMLGYTDSIEDMKGILDDTIQSTFSISPNVNGNLHYSPSVSVVNNIDVSTDPLGQTVKNIKTFSGGAKNDYNYGMGV